MLTTFQGINKGHKTTPRDRKPRVSRTKGHLSKRTAFVREVVREIAGYVKPTSCLLWAMKLLKTPGTLCKNLTHTMDSRLWPRNSY